MRSILDSQVIIEQIWPEEDYVSILTKKKLKTGKGWKEFKIGEMEI